MKYTLRRPCAKCPFRTDVHPYLTRGRAIEIARGLMRGDFACHSTLDYSDDENGDCEGKDTDKTQHCAGALIMLEHMEQPHQMMRICERLGLYDRTKLDMASPVFKDTTGFITHHGKPKA